MIKSNVGKLSICFLIFLIFSIIFFVLNKCKSGVCILTGLLPLKISDIISLFDSALVIISMLFNTIIHFKWFSKQLCWFKTTSMVDLVSEIPPHYIYSYLSIVFYSFYTSFLLYMKPPLVIFLRFFDCRKLQNPAWYK